MDVCSAAGKPPGGIGHESPISLDHSQQRPSGDSLTAPDARSHGAGRITDP